MTANIVTWVFLVALAGVAILAIARLAILERSISMLSRYVAGRVRAGSRAIEVARDIEDVASELEKIGLSSLNEPLLELGELIKSTGVGGAALEHSRSSKELITSDRLRDALLERGKLSFINYHTLHAFPGICTAIGILGTFIGLVIAVGTTDAEGVPDIRQLTEGLDTAFYSSIAGLVISIFLTIFLRRTEGRLDGTVQKFTDWLDSRLPKRDDHWLLGEILKQQREATGALRTLKDDLYEALSSALTNTVVPELAKAFESHAPAQQQAAIAEMVDGVVKQIGGHLERAAEQFDAAANQTRQAAEWWTKVAHELENVTKEQALLVGAISRAAEPVADAVGKADQLHSKLEDTAIALQEGAQQLAAAGSSQKEVLEKLVVGLGTMVDRALGAIEEMQRVRSSWAESAQNLQVAAKELNSGFSTFVGQFPKAIQDNLVLFDKELARVVKGLAAQGDDLKNNVRDLNAPVAELQRSISKLAAALRSDTL